MPEEFDGKLTKSLIDEYGLKSSASMVSKPLSTASRSLCCTFPVELALMSSYEQGLSKKHDISSEDKEVVKAGKEHLIKCLEASFHDCSASNGFSMHSTPIACLAHAFNAMCIW